MKTNILLLFCLFSNQVLFGQAKLPPPKLEIADYSLSKFLTEFAIAVGKKDKAFVLNHLSPHIKNGFGGDEGIEGFQQSWNFDDPNSHFWKMAERLLVLGGGGYKEGANQYSIPYIFSNWRYEAQEYDPFKYAAITGSNVNVRNEPNIRTSKVLGQLDYHIVKILWDKGAEMIDQQQILGEANFNGPSWIYVCTPDDSLCGFVYWKYVVSPIGFRMGFGKINGKWQITYIVAGD